MPPAETPGSSLPVVIFGLLACVRLTAFESRAADAGRSPSYEDRVTLGALATTAFTQFERLRDRLVGLGADPWSAMRPFQEAITGFHERTRPADSMEALTKVYVADSIFADLYLDVARSADPAIEETARESLADSGHAALVTERLRAAALADTCLASRLGLWARRLVGEALSQAHALTVCDDGLRGLFGDDGVAAAFERVVDRHQARMRAISLRD